MARAFHELFGYVKGAFSGALKDEPGLVRSASGGTLDEIGELPATAQATLLRVLQEKEILPVRGTRPVPVDLREVAATLKPVDGDPSFRADLVRRLEETKGNVNELARSMSTTRMQIHRWMKRFGLDPETFRR